MWSQRKPFSGVLLSRCSDVCAMRAGGAHPPLPCMELVPDHLTRTPQDHLVASRARHTCVGQAVRKGEVRGLRPSSRSQGYHTNPEVLGSYFDCLALPGGLPPPGPPPLPGGLPLPRTPPEKRLRRRAPEALFGGEGQALKIKTERPLGRSQVYQTKKRSLIGAPPLRTGQLPIRVAHHWRLFGQQHGKSALGASGAVAGKRERHG
eukprot:12540287-Alexandrium_andersonii.AAC.1